jgi:hypothetical protein
VERSHRHKGYDVTLTSVKEVGGWVPAATVKSAPMQSHRDEWTIRETSRPQPNQDAADRIALEQAISSIDKQTARAQGGQQGMRPQPAGPQGLRPQAGGPQPNRPQPQPARPDAMRQPKNDFRKQSKAG